MNFWDTLGTFMSYLILFLPMGLFAWGWTTVPWPYSIPVISYSLLTFIWVATNTTIYSDETWAAPPKIFFGEGTVGRFKGYVDGAGDTVRIKYSIGAIGRPTSMRARKVDHWDGVKALFRGAVEHTTKPIPWCEIIELGKSEASNVEGAIYILTRDWNGIPVKKSLIGKIEDRLKNMRHQIQLLIQRTASLRSISNVLSTSHNKDHRRMATELKEIADDVKRITVITKGAVGSTIAESYGEMQ